MTDWLAALGGGVLIGLASAMLLLLNGRIAGISGIVARLFGTDAPAMAPNIAFVLGLMAGPLLFLLFSGSWPDIRIQSSWPVLVLGGLLVGFGSRMGSGCTSGHAVMGLARLSPRSMVATATFMLTAFATVFLMRVGGLS